MAIRNLQTASLSNDAVSIEYLTSGALRLVGLYYRDQPENLLGLSPDLILQLEQNEYPVIGGHRLWASPENPGWSFGPEQDIPLEIDAHHNHVRLIQKRPEAAGMRKSITITLDEHLPQVTLRHELINDSDAPITAAPWALTVPPVGGMILLPFPRSGPASPLLPERNLVFWPYTNLENLRMQYFEDGVFLPSTGRTGPSKLGTWLKAGWCGYFNGSVFLKKSVPAPAPFNDYPDYGCSCEVYLAENFLELETLGPLTEIQPGESASHTETWNLVTELETDPDLAPYATRLHSFFQDQV